MKMTTSSAVSAISLSSRRQHPPLSRSTQKQPPTLKLQKRIDSTKPGKRNLSSFTTPTRHSATSSSPQCHRFFLQTNATPCLDSVTKPSCSYSPISTPPLAASPKKSWSRTLLGCSSNGIPQPPLKPCSSNLRIESPLPPPGKMHLPSRQSFTGHTTISNKWVVLILHVANGPRWIPAQKTGRYSSDISRQQTKTSGESIRRAPQDITAQRTRCKPRAPCSRPPKPPSLPANWP
jgi:hypothetical protein